MTHQTTTDPRGNLHGAGSPLPTPADSTTRPSQYIRVVYQDYRGWYWYTQPEVDAVQSVWDAMRQVRQVQASCDAARRPWRFLSTLLRKHVVEMARVSTTRLDDVIEGQHPSRRVELSATHREACPGLTAMFNDHQVMGSEVIFAQSFPSLITGSQNGQVLVVSYKLRKSMVIRLVVLWLALSGLIGVAIGKVTSSVPAGFSAFGGLMLVVTVPLSVIFWISG
ncbi:hypothetical protein M406DRAFT_331352 [Cryphonectria parasitica EP155]|uniref:Uncharacterized protein n=1 Tax=Cryphonectria parasitica (strain ATCC 38755 / EP155) TaxID=660469 RepID=A0A9P4Y218_CRYP1|nr:uncharacterized protein M406DRAFT_331352 [Cryphonectria parasitica EP155]KAF3765038.1 hypothetical protein M406DRAFT_331352 [Cryphonectria parasitica EP155]